jgi:hypothetical protein
LSLEAEEKQRFFVSSTNNKLSMQGDSLPLWRSTKGC